MLARTDIVEEPLLLLLLLHSVNPGVLIDVAGLIGGMLMFGCFHVVDISSTDHLQNMYWYRSSTDHLVPHLPSWEVVVVPIG